MPRKTDFGSFAFSRTVSVILICLYLSGCGSYTYGQSIIRRWTTETGEVMPNDKAVVELADNVYRAWSKRKLAVNFLGVAADAADSGASSGVVSAITTALDMVPGVGMIVSVVLNLTSKFVGMLNTNDRQTTYADGAQLVEAAISTYIKSRQAVAVDGKITISTSTLTADGILLLDQLSKAQHDVDVALSGHIQK